MISAFGFCIRNFSCCCQRNSMAREARMLQKMIKRGLSPKKPQYGNNLISKTFLQSPYDNEDCGFRLTSLNKVYMENITEMIHKGSTAIRFAELEIEVTKVALSKHCNFLNIYYISKKTGVSEKILKETLSVTLAELQAKMGELRYIGRVPYLKFVRDKMLENSIQLEKIFKVMDFGRDYEPIHDKKVVTQDYPVEENGLPKMRQNVLGIDADGIKKKIEAEIFRFKAINIETSENNMNPEPEFPEKLMKFSKKDFFKFLKRRRIAELKRRKMELKQMNSLKSERENIPNMFEDEDEDEDEYYMEDEKECYMEDEKECYMEDKEDKYYRDDDNK